jgi:hypothetical protein
MSRFAFVLMSSVLLGIGCTVAGPPPVALYPGADANRLPASQVANISGPIAKIDDRDVSQLGGWFDLLPGCHVIEMLRQSSSSFILGAGNARPRPLPFGTLFALRMKAGARYTVRQDFISDQGSRLRLIRSAREVLSGGATADFDPVKSRDEILACRDWEATQHG